MKTTTEHVETDTGRGPGSLKTQFNEEGRPVEEVHTQNGMKTTTTTKYEGSHILSIEVRPGLPAQPMMWNYWKYDSAGKLTAFRRGRGDALQNHYTNFKRDNQGRLTSHEYRQEPGDHLAYRTEYNYSTDCKIITETHYGKDSAPFRKVIETLDPKGKVNGANITEWDWRTKQPQRTLRVTLKYDEEGRPVEQTTDLYEPEADGAEFELQPGTVSLVYEDAKHTRRISCDSPEGSLSSAIVLDSRIATTEHRSLAPHYRIRIAGGANGCAQTDSGAARRFFRWRDRDYHYHYGSGIETAPPRRVSTPS